MLWMSMLQRDCCFPNVVPSHFLFVSPNSFWSIDVGIFHHAKEHISIFTAAHTSLAAETTYSRPLIASRGGADCAIGPFQLNRAFEACPNDVKVASQCR